MESLYGRYVRTVTTEIERAGAHRGELLDSVYVGGGTPTVLSVPNLGKILASVERDLGLSEDAEITLEANPGTVDESRFSQLRCLGFNRLSIGVQSLDDEFLTVLGRVHTAQQAIEAYTAARHSGFDNISIDLIFGLPGQTLSHWKNTLDSALRLAPEHISLYELTVEDGTRLAEMCALDKLSLPEEDLQIEMYELAIEKLNVAGFKHYEVSNFARPGFRCRHNQVYWRNEPYYGFGAGATSYVLGDRSVRLRDPLRYIDAIESGADAIESTEHLTGRALLAETLIQGLRMLEGVEVPECFAEEIARLESRGFVERAASRIRVTRKGLLLLNDVSEELLS
jgi:oxygen-independent coproporphyrinogen-3 oxidase